MQTISTRDYRNGGRSGRGRSGRRDGNDGRNDDRLPCKCRRVSLCIRVL